MRLVAVVAVVAGLLAAHVWLRPLPGTTARQAHGERVEIQRDGRSLVYWTQGAGLRVVLLASAGREASDFNELARSLAAAGYRTVALEAPGIGGSQMPEAGFHLYDFAADVKAVIDADAKGESSPRAVVVGHAFGNRVARATAARFPETIWAVVLIGAGGQHPVPEDANRALLNCFDPLRGGSQRLADIRFAFFARSSSIPSYWRRGWHADTARLQGSASAATPDQAWLEGGKAPILVLQGEADRIAPPELTGEVLHQAHPERVILRRVPDAGHALLPEQPRLIAAAVVEFLNQRGAVR